jgi:hypothetical protein
MCVTNHDRCVPSLTRPELVGPPSADPPSHLPARGGGLAQTWLAVPVEPWAGATLASPFADDPVPAAVVAGEEAVAESGTMSGGL